MRAEKREPRLGVDIGRVIIDGSSHPAGGDTAFFTGDEAALLATPEMAGAFAAIALLGNDFEGRIWLVSKCGPRVAERSRRWLDGHDFWGRTGVAPDHLRFCRIRSQKRLHCDELGLTHFVDDRADVHAAIRGSVDHQYFFGPGHDQVPPYGTATPTWADVLREIRVSRRSRRRSPGG
jgi:hypothetical protein